MLSGLRHWIVGTGATPNLFQERMMSEPKEAWCSNRSFPRKRESREAAKSWIPALAAMSGKSESRIFCTARNRKREDRHVRQPAQTSLGPPLSGPGSPITQLRPAIEPPIGAIEQSLIVGGVLGAGGKPDAHRHHRGIGFHVACHIAAD